MGREEYGVGDIVFSRIAIENDGGIPGLAADALLAAPGVRGVVVNFGHAQMDENEEIYLVRFEDGAGELGPPVGCLPEELTQDEVEARALAEGAS
jgi:nitrogen fixation protein NifZ